MWIIVITFLYIGDGSTTEIRQSVTKTEYSDLVECNLWASLALGIAEDSDAAKKRITGVLPKVSTKCERVGTPT